MIRVIYRGSQFNLVSKQDLEKDLEEIVETAMAVIEATIISGDKSEISHLFGLVGVHGMRLSQRLKQEL